MDVLPDIELRPIGNRKNTHTLSSGLFCIIESPQFRTLALWVPTVVGGAEGKHPPLCTAYFFVTPCPAKGHIEAMQIKCLLEALGFPHICMHLRAMFERVDSARLGFRVLVDNQLHSGFPCHAITKFVHRAKLPRRIHM